MGLQSQPRPSLATVRSGLRHVLHTIYPSYVFRHAVFRPFSLLSILFVLALISMGFYLVVPFTLLPRLATHPLATTLWLLLFVWSIFCATFSYLLAATTIPGRVPPSWKPQLWRHELPAHPGVPVEARLAPNAQLYPVPPRDVSAACTAMLRTDARYRFCLKCKLFKPDRAHHCSTCHECVLQMDHHCPFVGNSCIGLYNRKFFILFLYYATSSCALVAALTPQALISHLRQLDHSLTPTNLGWTVALLIAYMLCALHVLALAPFSVFHTYLALKNTTTIENQEIGLPTHLDVLRRNDKGWLQNWNAIFGPTPWLWFVPVTYGRDTDANRWVALSSASADEAV